MQDFQVIWDKAMAAGRNAALAITPVPMVVGEAKSLFSNEIDYTKPTEVVADGVCGFAWIDIFERKNSPLCKWIKANELGRDRDGKGVYVWIRGYGQSMQRKEAHAQAMAKVLQEELGVKAYAASRLD